jgi:hypothetical protein
MTFNAWLSGLHGNLFADLIPIPTGQSVVSFSSDFLDFSATTQRTFDVNLSALSNPLLPSADNFLNSFTSPGTATFASAPAPALVTFVPEPSSLALFTLGCGALAGWRWRRTVFPCHG